MNKGPIFLAGFLTGIFVSFFGLFVFFMIFRFSSHSHNDKRERSIPTEYESIVEDVTPAQDEIQYFEVKGRKGEVSLFTDMPKDSARVLMGKPTSVNMRSYGGVVTEEWKYEFPGEGKYGLGRSMTLEFRNGKLESIRDY